MLNGRKKKQDGTVEYAIEMFGKLGSGYLVVMEWQMARVAAVVKSGRFAEVKIGSGGTVLVREKRIHQKPSQNLYDE